MLEIKNCLTCKWEPEWTILPGVRGYKQGLCEFPWPDAWPACEERRSHNVYRKNRTKKIYIPTMGWKEITNCPAHQPKDAEGAE